MKVKRVIYDWYFTNEGEDCSSFEVGQKNVTSIEYHSPMGDGDRHFVDVNFDNGKTKYSSRIFNLHSVVFEEVANES